MAEIRLTTKDDDYPIIYRVLTIPGGAGFQPSTVVFISHLFVCENLSLVESNSIHPDVFVLYISKRCFLRPVHNAQKIATPQSLPGQQMLRSCVNFNLSFSLWLSHSFENYYRLVGGFNPSEKY